MLFHHRNDRVYPDIMVTIAGIIVSLPMFAGGHGWQVPATGGVIGAYIGRAALKKHFNRAGIA